MNTALKGKWVFDSNLLIYFLDKTSPFHPKANDLFAKVKNGFVSPTVAQQNILETESVLKRHSSLNMAQIADLTESLLVSFKFQIVGPLSTTIRLYHSLIRNTKKQVDPFDCYLAATIIDNRLSRFLTLNTKDFNSFKDLEVVNPLA